ncbi:MAG TPA: hypothetical protein VK961_23530 [Chthoniobacter sp.]|nr:hypothetical protein [Chthoniobacter sp.]
MNESTSSYGDSSAESQPDPVPVLSLVSLIHALLGVFGWLTFFILAGAIAVNHKTTSETNTAIGLLAMIGLAVNLVMMICALISAFRTKYKALSLAAAFLNGLELAVIIAVIIHGISITRHH